MNSACTLRICSSSLHTLATICAMSEVLSSAFLSTGNRYASQAKNVQHIRRADTNIIGIQFSILKKSGGLHTGDAVICENRNCTAALSHLSKLSSLPGSEEKVQQSWECGFCKLSWAIDGASF